MRKGEAHKPETLAKIAAGTRGRKAHAGTNRAHAPRQSRSMGAETRARPSGCRTGQSEARTVSNALRLTPEQFDAYQLRRAPAAPKPPVPYERDILAATLKLLRLHPKVAWAQRMNSGMFKVGDSDRWVRAAFKGCSDIIGQMRDGQFLAIEVKRPGKQPTEEQATFLEHVQAHGGVAFVVSDIADLEGMMNAEV